MNLVNGVTRGVIKIELWNLVLACKCDVMRKLLNKAKIPNSVIKERLQKRLYHAIVLGYPVVPTLDEKRKAIAASRQEKLIIDGGVAVPHPLSIRKWDAGMSAVPLLDESLIDKYFDEKNKEKGIYTEGIKARTDGRSMLLSERINSIEYSSIADYIPVSFVRAYVTPQMFKSKPPYFVYIMLSDETGEIKTADCHCKSGLSGLCKHVATLAYAVAKIIQDGRNVACTSKVQTWHRGAKAKHSAMLVDIKTPKAKPDMELTEKPRRDEFDPRHPDLRRKRKLADYDLTTLYDITGGQAAILSYVSMPVNQGPDPDDLQLYEVEVRTEDFPYIITKKPKVGIPEVQTHTSHAVDFTRTNSPSCVLCKDVYQELIDVGVTALGRLAVGTTSQDSTLWLEVRRYRVSSTKVNNVPKTSRGDPAKTVADILYKDFKGNEDTQRGVLYEHVARKKFSETFGLSVKQMGCVVSTTDPWLCASPDGLIGDNSILEIKCPKLPLREKVKNAKYDVMLTKSGDYKLKEKSSYRCQVQVAMYCLNRQKCYFYVWHDLEQAMFIEERDDVFLRKTLLRAREFYFTHLLPTLVDDIEAKRICVSKVYRNVVKAQ